MAEEPPALSLVVTTIGRVEALRRLLRSLSAIPEVLRVELVVVDQSADQRCAQLVRSMPPAGPWQLGTSGRGASVGRNVGMALATGELIAFPDDNCWYDPDTVTGILAAFADPSLAALSGRQLTASGAPSMLRWRRQACPVRRTNFLQTTICSTIVVRRSVLDEVGGFDETIGVGSPGMLGSGEESDLVLRILAAGFRMDYRPDIVVRQDDDRDAPTEKFVDKMLKYGTGQGHLWRRHHLSLAQLAWFSGRKLVGASIRAARGDHVLARADLAYLRGTAAGLAARR